MLNNKAIVLYISLCIYIPSSFASENDYDKVCGYFTQLQEKLKHHSLTNNQRADFMNSLVDKNLDTDNPVRQSWEALLSAVPNQRYEIFRETAKEVGGMSNWHCAPMKMLYPTIGD
jgi:hypothetical protein